MEIILQDLKQATLFQFPVNPEEINIKRDRAYETVNLLGIGEVDFMAGEKLKEISFSSFFPIELEGSYHQWGEMGYLHPRKAMAFLTALTTRKTPVWLKISDTGITALVTVTAHNSTIRGGEPGDVYFDIVFRTWRDAQVRTLTEKPRVDIQEPVKIYVVKAGDSLSKIAKKELGNSNRYSEIYALNKKLIGSDQNLIKPGQKLVMPK